MRRRSVKALASLVVAIAVLSGASYAYLRRSLPVIDGVVSVTGPSAPIDIVRDRDAIPHIFAATKSDALFGLGYVHAQDRLWQMELQRRIGHGRLAEIFGPAAVSQDRFLRTVGFGRAAAAAWNSTPDWARQQIDAYVAGVNAFVSTRRGSRLPPEFTLLGVQPEPWTGVDVIVWVKMMAWDLSANYSFELLRRDLVQLVGVERMRQLMPPYAADGPSILHARDIPVSSRRLSSKSEVGRVLLDPAVRLVRKDPPYTSAFDSWSAAFRAALSQGEPRVRDFLLGAATTEALGSNNWVVDGSLTATAKPLLANDPHLGTRLPSIWYLAHLSAGAFDVIGATLPGVPAVALGRNRFIAWGTTNVAADVEDLYRERIDATGRFAEYRGNQEPLTILSEIIKVKGAAPVQIEVRITRHGPLVSDAINANNAALVADPKPAPLDPLAFRWTALDPDDTTLAAFLKLNDARNWDDFTNALRYFVVPSQNFVYGDVDGHIGYYAPGRIPIRAGGDGSLPIEGWSGDTEWTGWIPFDQLPHLYDPPEHFIVTANNRPAPAGYPHLLGHEWPEPYRAQRITDLLSDAGRSVRLQPDGTRSGLTPDDFARIQADTLSQHAKTLLPVLLPLAHPTDPDGQRALAVLRDWNGDARGDLAAPAIFEAWFLKLVPALVGDDLGPRVTENYLGRFSFTTRFLVSTLGSQAVRLKADTTSANGTTTGVQLLPADPAARDSAWCDDVRTPGVRERCEEAVTAALNDAVADLTVRLGRDLTRWRWDEVHRAVFPHQLDSIAMLRPILSRSIPNGGDWSTVNVGTVSADRPYEQRSVASYREIIDLSPANDSRFIDAVGESGHPLSRHYDDFLQDWQKVRYRPMRMERKDVEAGAIGHLRLTPR